MTFESLALDAIEMPLTSETNLGEAAFEDLFKQNFKTLCTYCQYRFGFSLDEAKEAVHMAFIRLWENRESISPTLSVKAYLYKIVANVSLDMLKHDKVKQKHAKEVIRHAPVSTPLKNFTDPELKQMMTDINTAVEELPEQMQRIFLLSRYEGLKYAEIASRLGISVKTVETQMSRALVKLRQRLSHYLILLILILLFSW
jgi:RNA polymerase sigma-70 factor (ECF subfamily)